MKRRVLPNLNKRIVTQANTQELLQASKAIYDAVMKRVPDCVDDRLDPRIKDLEKSVTVLVGSVLNKEIEGRVKALEIEHAKTLATFVKAAEQRMADMKQLYEQHFQSFTAMMKALPVPNVIVPENAIQMLPSYVTVNEVVNVPKQDSPIVNVTNQVPEQPVPIVHVEKTVVNIPEQKTPIVNVNNEVKVPKGEKPILNVPKDAIRVELKQSKKKETKTKSILYDQVTGRPKSIIEETTEE